MRFLILLFFFVAVQSLFSQEDKTIRYIEVGMFEDRLDVYQSTYKNIQAVDIIEKPIFIAAHYYPHLKEINIEFRERKMKMTMMARPSVCFLFQKKENRKYVIIVNNDSINRAPRIVQNMSINMQVGVIGHEYAHITDYEHMNSLQIIKYGLQYLFKKQRRIIEYRTDSIAIAHGLGWQIHHFATYINNSEEISERYKKYKHSIYLRPKQIADIIERHKEKKLNL